jgi:hypothetical protein
MNNAKPYRIKLTGLQRRALFAGVENAIAERRNTLDALNRLGLVGDVVRDDRDNGYGWRAELTELGHDVTLRPAAYQVV